MHPNVQVTDKDPSHYFGTTVTICPVDGVGAPLLPQVRYLGEGAGEYAVATADEQLVIKKHVPFRFENSHSSPYFAPARKGAPERVWACSGSCGFSAGLHELIDLGPLPGGINLHLLFLMTMMTNG
ncbi:MAG: hypothetical protein R2932_04730 [Caldilineaceae bacterium]